MTTTNESYFRNLLTNHLAELKSIPGANNHWIQRHQLAWVSPRRQEIGIRNAILAYADLAESYRYGIEWEPGDRELGQDGYFHEHAKDLIEAMLAYLNFDCGRFDCGTLDGLIRQLAKESGVELEP